MVTFTRGTIINVPGDYGTIQAGIDAAINWDTVLVHPGNYFENVSLFDKNIVIGSLFILNGDTSYISQTVIDGGNTDVVIMVSNVSDTTAVISGFTITNGNGAYGGGINLQYSSNLRLEHLIIKDNQSNSRGGGINIWMNSNPTISDVTVRNNYAAWDGGGIDCHSSCNPRIIKSIITDNYAQNTGGGVYCTYASNLYIRESVIARNQVSWHGAGLASQNNSTAYLINVTIVDNISGWGGGGISLYENSSSILVNSIIWNNVPYSISFESTGLSNSLIVTHSDIQDSLNGIITNNNGTINWIAGNIDSDPSFITAITGNYHLRPNSPCIDSGTDYFNWNGNTLIELDTSDYIGTAPDMGTFEFDPALYEAPIEVSIPELSSYAGDTVQVPINIQFPVGYSISSAEMQVNGYQGFLELVGINTDSSLSGDYGWSYQFHETDSMLNIALAGADDIIESGDLIRMEFEIPDTAMGFNSIYLRSALFDTGAFDVTLNSGGISIIPPYNGPVWHIAVSGSDIIGNGSITTPFASIQRGITFAIDGDTVLVQPGTYFENLNFNGKNITVGSLILLAGDASYITTTIIDGTAYGSVVTFENGEDSSAEFVGFTITNGRACNGGGIRCQDSSPTLNRLVIHSNKYASDSECTHIKGGIGIYVQNASPSLTNSKIYNNNVLNTTNVLGCGARFDESSIYMRNVVVYSNHNSGFGGGMASINSSPILINTTIKDNSADWGGGIYCIDSHLLFNRIDRCSIYNNSAISNLGNDLFTTDITINDIIVDTFTVLVPLETHAFPIFYFIFDIEHDTSGATLSANYHSMPLHFTLYQNHPNPFNPTTTIQYELPQRSDVQITIYDLLGKEITTLVSETQEAGFKSIQWNATKVPSGMYFYQIRAGEYVQTRKMVVLK